MAMTRRTFGTFSLAAPLIRGAHAKAETSTDVIIIGAGLSGLNAAWLLTDAGYDVTVLEGASRLGGRVWSARDVETKPELGASQIGPSYARTLDAIQRLDLKMIDEDRDIMPFTYHIDGTLIRAEDWVDSSVNKTVGAERKIPPIQLASSALAKLTPFQELDDWLSPEFSSYDISVDSLFQTSGLSPEARKLATLTQDTHNFSALGLMQEGFRSTYAARFSEGVSSASMPMRDQLESAASTNGPKNVAADKWPKNIVGGTWQLPKAMADRLRRPVMTDKVVVAIDMNKSGVEVRCLDGTSVKAKYVISAVPFSTLRHVVITPNPDPLHRAAISEIGYADTTRAFGLIKEPFWDEDGMGPSIFSDSPLRMLWVLDNHKNGKGPYRCMFVMISQAAEQVALLPPERAVKFLQGAVERIRPASRGQIEIVKYHSWGRQPLQGGCRHYFKPGQITEFGVRMIEPWQRLHFAGEHTRRLEQGMESAMESGERVAQEILARL